MAEMRPWVEFDEAWLGPIGCGVSSWWRSMIPSKELAKLDPRKSQVVEMRIFGGLSAAETAEVLKLSEIPS